MPDPAERTPDWWVRVLTAPERERISVSEACRRYGISRKTYYGRRARYQESGREGLEPRSRRPKRSPDKTPLAIEAAVVRLRLAQPWLGARRIAKQLASSQGRQSLSVSTAHRVLRSHGLAGDSEAVRALRQLISSSPFRLDATPTTMHGATAWALSTLDEDGRLIDVRAVEHVSAAEACECIELALRSSTSFSTHERPERIYRRNGGSGVVDQQASAAGRRSPKVKDDTPATTSTRLATSEPQRLQMPAPESHAVSDRPITAPSNKRSVGTRPRWGHTRGRAHRIRVDTRRYRL